MNENPTQPDYLTNLEVVERFPFNLYHDPLRHHVLNAIQQESARGSLRILNVGCGLSQVVRHIPAHHEYVGVDVDPRAVEICRSRFPGVQFETSDPYSLPFPDAHFDVIFATEVVEHVLEPERWIAELMRVLKPGGRLELSTPNYGDITLPLIENTFLELVARTKGFSRQGLHPTKFSRRRLQELLLRAGLSHVDVRKTPGLLALVSTARKPLDSASLPIRDLVNAFDSLIKSIPVSLAVREVQRLVVLLKKLPENCLVWDVGCGDGSFWKVFRRGAGVTVDGVDLDAHEIGLARKTGVYRRLDVADVSRWVPDCKYDVVVGNCSLEHVPDIHSALRNIRQAMQDDGRLLMFVPAFGWPKTVPWIRSLGKLSSRLEMAVSGLLDGFFQHHHIYDRNTWQLVIEAAGFEVVESGALGSPSGNRLFRRCLPVAGLEFCYKTLFKRYPLGVYERALPDAEFFSELAEQPVRVDSPHRVEYVFVATPRPAG